jgi:N-acylglucosamine 2-epimerase
MRDYLLNNVLPFWAKHAIDRECGGLFNMIDREGRVYGTDKNAWFAGRTMYTYSLAYNELEKNEEYLEIAGNMYAFLPKCELNESGRLPFIVARDGRALVVEDAYFTETFAAIGCAEYYIATGDPEVWRNAQKYFNIAYELYLADLARTPSENPPVPETKALGPSMIMLATAQVLRKVDHDRYDPIARACADEILVHFIEGKGLMENVSLTGGFVDSPTGREINPGHSLEAAWFVMTEGVYQNNGYYKDKAKEIIDVSMAHGYRDGGIIAFCDCDGNPPDHLEWDMKIWWPQCEAMIANRLCYNVFGEEKYLRDFEAIRDWCFERYPDREHGEWYGYMHYDGTLANTLKGNFSKGPFHLPRMLYLVDKLERGENIW